MNKSPIPIKKRSMVFSKEIIGVQPMSIPSGRTMSMKVRFLSSTIMTMDVSCPACGANEGDHCSKNLFGFSDSHYCKSRKEKAKQANKIQEKLDKV